MNPIREELATLKAERLEHKMTFGYDKTIPGDVSTLLVHEVLPNGGFMCRAVLHGKEADAVYAVIIQQSKAAFAAGREAGIGEAKKEVLDGYNPDTDVCYCGSHGEHKNCERSQNNLRCRIVARLNNLTKPDKE